MYVSLGIVCVLLLLVFLLLLRFAQPLVEEEISKLANKRRQRKIAERFVFARGGYTANKEFKRRMNPDGSFYEIEQNLLSFPAVAAALLKYKKHEWIIVAFEKDEVVIKLWVNKGFNRSAVSLYLPIEQVVGIAQEVECRTVLVSHNHPNPYSRYVHCNAPSARDLDTAKEWASILNRNGINLVEFICERGISYEYYRSIADAFLPMRSFVSEIQKVNATSKWTNISLHFELYC